MSTHFCTCPTTKCPHHPENHTEGCDRCIQKNLKKKEMPTCFFQAVDEDFSSVKEFSIKGFVEFYLQRQEPSEETATKE